MKNKILLGIGLLFGVILILSAYIIYSGVWLRENPNKYREAISKFVDVPSNARYNVIRHAPS